MTLTEGGPTFSFVDSTSEVKVMQALAGAYFSREAAREAYCFLGDAIPVAPSIGSDVVGDESMVWHSHSRSGPTTMLLRQGNFVCRFTWRGDPQEALEFAKQLDSIVTSDSPYISRGRLLAEPVVSGFPEEMVVTSLEELELSPSCEELGRANATFDVWAPSFINLGVSGKGGLRLRAPAQPGEYTVWLTATNDSCLVLRKSLRVIVND
ncbi:MAG: hypothetical protein ABIJ61_05635 [bacterium]